MVQSPMGQVGPALGAPSGPAQSGPAPGRAPGMAQRPADLPPLGLDGYCPVQLIENYRWVRGSPDYGVIHRDRLYLFVGPNEARRFFADPDRYAPVLSGCDVVLAIDQNQLAPGMRKYGVTCDVDNRVYLFASPASKDRFSQAPERYAAAVARAMADSARRAAAPENPYGAAAGYSPSGRF